MTEKICEICGKEFDAKGRDRVCGDCRGGIPSAASAEKRWFSKGTNSRSISGASKLWRHIIDHTDYGSIVYYVDRNYYNADSMGFLDGVEYAGHTDSFWNYWVKENRLANREPSRHAEVTDGYAEGSVLQIFNAGTDTYVWRRK